MFRAFFLVTVIFTSPVFSQSRFNNDVFTHGPDGSLGKALAEAKAARDKREAVMEAGTLAAKGDYAGARNLLLRRGYLTEAAHIEVLRKADNADKK
jgi:hypothetical protein